MARLPDPATRGAGGRRGPTRRAAGATLVAVLGLAGSGLIGTGLLAAPPQPPQPGVEAAPPDVPAAGSDPASGGPSSASPGVPSAPVDRPPVGLARSGPTGIVIPKIGVKAKIMSLGVKPDGTVEVPPLERAQLAGWYRPGPSPGEIGNAVLLGHVDSSKIGPAVFFRLGALRPGNTIEVTREDGSTVRFTVDRVRSYPKKEFPTELVYGPSQQAGLRVVTCGGQFDKKSGSYLNNIVVSATRTP